MVLQQEKKVQVMQRSGRIKLKKQIINGHIKKEKKASINVEKWSWEFITG